ncbi:MAG: hypothetical protein IKC78_06605 [Alistipes sp.]|nr:hypothetical protein [Alistipes sp.]
MRIEDWSIEELMGYQPITTFYTDFSIADKFGINAIKETYQRAFKEWQHDYKYMTELAMVLNWKIWRWHGKNEEYAKLYDHLWREIDEWCIDNLKGEELEYYYKTTD